MSSKKKDSFKPWLSRPAINRSVTLPLTRPLTQRLSNLNEFHPNELDPFLLFDARDSMIGTLENPTLDLDPSKPDTLNVITATRAGTATFTDVNGLIASASPNTVRVDYVDSVPMILVEPSSENLLPYSEDFSQGVWNKNRVTIVDNSITSPDGSLNAAKLVETATTATHRTWTQATTTAATHSFSVFAKAGERKRIGLRDNQIGNSAVFDLESGSVISGSGGSITEAANGFFRITMTATYAAAGTRHEIYILPDNATTANTSYTGDGTSGVYLWGAQLETGVATSYIPTSGGNAAARTRAADDLVISGSAFTDFFSSSEGTFYAEFIFNDADGANSLIYGSADNQRFAYKNLGSSSPLLSYDGVNVLNYGRLAAGTLLRTALSFDSNTMEGSQDGSAATMSGQTAPFPHTGNFLSATELNIGSNTTGAKHLNGHIKRLIYWPYHSDSL